MLRNEVARNGHLVHWRGCEKTFRSGFVLAVAEEEAALGCRRNRGNLAVRRHRYVDSQLFAASEQNRIAHIHFFPPR